MSKSKSIGNAGEQFAVEYLLDKGYKVLERNYYFDRAEVDIIARTGNILAVIEVKSRSSIDYGRPHEFVKPRQIRNLVKAVDHYIESHDLNVEVRFDIIAVTRLGQQYSIEHIKNAFYHF